MQVVLSASLALAATVMPAAARQPQAPAATRQTALDPRTAVYELRTYYAAPGKLAALNARFRDHTLKLFAKHGMHNIVYWNERPTKEAPDGRIVYVLAYPSRAAREASWRAFGSDPQWRTVAAASEVNGKLVTRIDSMFLTMTDYSPDLVLPR